MVSSESHSSTNHLSGKVLLKNKQTNKEKPPWKKKIVLLLSQFLRSFTEWITEKQPGASGTKVTIRTIWWRRWRWSWAIQSPCPARATPSLRLSSAGTRTGRNSPLAMEWKYSQVWAAPAPASVQSIVWVWCWIEHIHKQVFTSWQEDKCCRLLECRKKMQEDTNVKLLMKRARTTCTLS